jgi:hypothetical protein
MGVISHCTHSYFTPMQYVLGFFNFFFFHVGGWPLKLDLLRSSKVIFFFFLKTSQMHWKGDWCSGKQLPSILEHFLGGRILSTSKVELNPGARVKKLETQNISANTSPNSILMKDLSWNRPFYVEWCCFHRFWKVSKFFVREIKWKHKSPKCFQIFVWVLIFFFLSK